MIRLVPVAIVTILFSAAATAIVGGGVPATEQISRHVVAVVGSNGSVCSGTAIARDLILTAAHCVESGSQFEVLELRDDQVRETSVNRFEQHPHFDFVTANAARPNADIAILKLIQPLSSRTTPIAIGGREFFPAGDQFVVAGLGSEQDIDDGTFGHLLTARLVAVRSHSDLQLRLIDPVTRNERTGQSACSGDSGGPVLEETRLGFVLVGVVSWTAGVNGNRGCGGVTGATPVASVRTWIVETAKLFGTPLEVLPGSKHQTNNRRAGWHWRTERDENRIELR